MDAGTGRGGCPSSGDGTVARAKVASRVNRGL